jgi:hypothetical protein
METKRSASIHFYFCRLALLSVLSMAITLTLCACSSSQKGFAQESETLVGYINIQDGKVILDEVEIITEEDTDRIEELGLTYQGDLIEGYYIYNEKEETRTFELTEKTKYHFVDMGQLYITSETSEDLVYETTSIDEFMNGSCYAASASANDQSDVPSHRIPYFVEVLGDEVLSITEEFRYTI